MADKKRRSIVFEEGDFVYVVLTKDRFPIGTYNKLKARKIGPVEILMKINDNVHRLRLPEEVHTFDVFNVKHLIPYYGEELVEGDESVNSRTNSFQQGEDDEALTSNRATTKHDLCHMPRPTRKQEAAATYPITEIHDLTLSREALHQFAT